MKWWKAAVRFRVIGGKKPTREVMIDGELRRTFDNCMKLIPPDGWGGHRNQDVDSLTNADGLYYTCANDPIGPWTEAR